jgi:DNA mismatch endonuclease, patch repair protein
LRSSFEKTLWKNDVRYRRNSSALFGKPDTSMLGKRIAIFVDACFWHGCKYHLRMPRSNREYWEKKISRNIKRDATVDLYYRSRGWTVLRFWEHDIKQNFESVIHKTIELGLEPGRFTRCSCQEQSSASGFSRSFSCAHRGRHKMLPNFWFRLLGGRSQCLNDPALSHGAVPALPDQGAQLVPQCP